VNWQLLSSKAAYIGSRRTAPSSNPPAREDEDEDQQHGTATFIFWGSEPIQWPCSTNRVQYGVGVTVTFWGFEDVKGCEAAIILSSKAAYIGSRPKAPSSNSPACSHGGTRTGPDEG
jgi:hypothetical protein